MPLPSSLPFVAFRRYSSKGVSEQSRASKDFTIRVKDDKYCPHDPRVRAIDFATGRLAEEMANYPCLQSCFGSHVTAVPVPRSSPHKPGTLWPTLRICESLARLGLCGDVQPLLVRATPVNKSATARPADRPSPEAQFESLAVKRSQLAVPGHMLIVDDVITRGATQLGCYARLSRSFVNSHISCFALIRTVSPDEVSGMLDPVAGTISLRGGMLHREP